MAIAPKKRPFDQDVSITAPTPGSSVLVALDGTVPVSGTFINAQCNAVFVKIYPSSVNVSGITSPPANDNTVIRFDRQAGATTFAGAVPAAVVGLNNTILASSNRLVAWPRLVDGQGQISFGSIERVLFRAFLQSAQGSVTVNATCCIWFTWTMDDVLSNVAAAAGGATSFGEVGPTYRPIRLVVPAGAANLVLTPDANGLWCHQPFNLPTDPDVSGPAGIADARSLESQNYQADALLSTNILQQLDGSDNPVAVRLNLLVGLWGTDSTVQTPEIDIGAAQTTFTIANVPAGANYLFLAFHDGHEWSNNQGAVSVQVQWS